MTKGNNVLGSLLLLICCCLCVCLGLKTFKGQSEIYSFGKYGSREREPVPY